MLERHITVSKTARYFLLGEPSEKISHIWFVCHGYGQLANFFLKNFEILDDGSTLIVSPEGMHRFYRNGFEGKVVACWMTREDRQADINDYVNFLDTLYTEILGQFKNRKPEISFLGFSQGAATVCRWINFGKAKPDNLVLWAGFFPTDFPPLPPGSDPANQPFGTINTTIVVGNQDEFLLETSLDEFAKILEDRKIKYRLVRFEGKHEIKPEVLKSIARH